MTGSEYVLASRFPGIESASLPAACARAIREKITSKKSSFEVGQALLTHQEEGMGTSVSDRIDKSLLYSIQVCH